VGGPSDVSPPGRSYQGQPGPYPQGGPGSDGEHPNRNIVSMSERYVTYIVFKVNCRLYLF